MIIHVYAITWNEEKVLPYFFMHYDNIADHYFIFDHDSTDNTFSMLKSHPNVTINKFEPVGDSLVLSSNNLINQFWKASKGKADWVIICDVDEHLYYSNNLRKYLQECTAKGITLVVPTGYDMVSDSFPDTITPLHETIRHGVRAPLLDKPQIFNPNEIQEINFWPGRHLAFPVGNVIKPQKNEVLLLHYKSLGFDYLNARYSVFKERMWYGDIQRKLGIQYFWDEKRKLEEFENLKKKAVRVL